MGDHGSAGRFFHRVPLAWPDIALGGVFRPRQQRNNLFTGLCVINC